MLIKRVNSLLVSPSLKGFNSLLVSPSLKYPKIVKYAAFNSSD